MRESSKKKEGFKTLGYISNEAHFFLDGLIIISGFLYLLFQWVKRNKFIDFVFVLLATLATILLLAILRNIYKFIEKNEPGFYIIDNSGKAREIPKVFKRFLDLFASRTNTTWAGSSWGLLAGLLPFILNFWPGDYLLKSLFSIYLFFVCFVTGLCLYLLVVYYIYTTKIWNLVEIKIWNRENELVNFLMKLGRRVSLGASLYISLTLTCWITSPVVPPGKELNLYVGFSVSLLLATLVFPLLLLIKKVRDLKFEELQKIDIKIQKRYLEILNDIDSAKDNPNFQFFNSLIEVREKLNKIRVIPDKMASVFTVIGIISLHIIPVVFKLVIEKMLK